MNNSLAFEDREFILQYEERLRGRNSPKNSKNSKDIPHRIRLKATGEFITTSSNKTIWKRKGAATSALRNDFPSIWWWEKGEYVHKVTSQPEPDWKIRADRQEEVFQEFLHNHVEFVPCP